MFRKLQKKIQNTSNEAQKTGDREKIIKLKRKIMRTGFWMTVSGYIGFLICAVSMILDGIAGKVGGSDVRFWIAVFFIIPFGIVCFIGNRLAFMGAKIQIMLQKQRKKSKK